MLVRVGQRERRQHQGLGGADMPCPGDAFAGESEVVALPDGIGVHLLDGDAVLHHGHGRKQACEFLQLIAIERPRQVLVPSERSEP